MKNVPDDYGNGWRRCPCGERYHLADGGCTACADALEAAQETCGEYKGNDCEGCPLGLDECPG